MRSTTLTTTLLLTAAALASGAALTPGLGRLVGVTPRCRNVAAQAAAARALGPTAALLSLRDTEPAVEPRDLSARDPPGPIAPCGILRGNQRSAGFTLEPSNVWNAFWVDDRAVVGGYIMLWELGGNDNHMLNTELMTHRSLRPFRPEAGRRYALELRVNRPTTAADEPIISWYFATQ